MWAKGVKYAALFLVGWLFLAGAAWGGTIALKSVFGVAEADVDRQIFEESQSYVQGTQRDLANLRLEYLDAETDAHRQAIRSTILHRVADFDRSRLTPDLQEFIRQLEQEAWQ